jgi:hypothetical protein
MPGSSAGSADGSGPYLLCGRCGLPLDVDPDDDPVGGPFETPICGACARDRDEDADLAMLDLRDGSLDGTIDW